MAASSAVSAAIAGLSAEAQEGHRNAFLCFLRTLEGAEVTVTTVTRKSYSGVFHTATPFANQSFDIAIKAVKPLNDAAVADAGKGSQKGSVLGSTVIFKGSDVADITVRKSAIEFKALGSAGDLQTDANVQSRAGGHGRDLTHLEGRTLEGVQTSWLAAGDGEDLNSSKSRTWNQFEVNKKLFNVETSYDENLYTTKLNKGGLSEKQRKHAEKASREIMGQASSNSHQAEERGQAHAADDMDDEDRYSGVLVGNASGKLVQRHEAAGTAGGGEKGAWGRNSKLGSKKAAAAAATTTTDTAAEDYQEVANRAVAAAVKSSTNKMPSIVPVSLEDLEGSAAPAPASSPAKPPPGIKKAPPGVGATGDGNDEDKTPAKLSAKAAEWTPGGGFGGDDSAPTTPTGASAAAGGAADDAAGGGGPMALSPAAGGMLQDPAAMYAAGMMAMPPPGYMGGPQMMPPGPGGYPGGPGMIHPGLMVQQQGDMMRDPRSGGAPMPAFGGYQGGGGGGGGYRGHPGQGGYQGGGGGAYANNGGRGRGGRGGRGGGRGGRGGGRGGGGDYNSDGGGGGGYRGGGSNPEAAAFQEAQQAAMLAMQGGGMPMGGPQGQGQSQGPAGNMPAFDDGRQHHHHQRQQHQQHQHMQMQHQHMQMHHHQQHMHHHQQHMHMHPQSPSADQTDGASSEAKVDAAQAEAAAERAPASSSAE